MKKLQDHIIPKWFFLFVIFGAFFAYWYFFAFSHSIEIWTPNEDAPIMGFAQAVNVDFWLRTSGSRALSQAQYYQPGLPFQFASWILYRLSYFWQSTSPIELFKLSIQNPAPFWMSMQISALLLSFLSCFLLWKKAIRYGIMTAIAATLIFYSAMSACRYGFIIFWNESFTLLFAVIYFFIAISFLQAEESRRWIWLIASGVAAGFLYLHKMNYVVWGLALLPAIFSEALLNLTTWKSAMKQAAIYLATLIAVIIVFGRILLGSVGFKHMRDAHKEIFFSSGIYGSGPKTIVDWNTMVSNATHLFTTEKSLFLLTALVFILGFAYFFINLRHREWLKHNVPELVLLTAATVAMTLSLIKHYQYHYTVSIAAVLPFWILWLARNRCKVGIYLSIPIILMGMYLGATSNFANREREIVLQTKMHADEKEILAMPMESGQIRLWVYRNRTASFQRLFILNFSGLTNKLQNEVNEVQGPQYLASPWYTAIEFKRGYTDIKDTPWRYFVLDKNINDNWLDWNAYAWLKCSTIKRTDLRNTVVYENLNINKHGSL